MGVVGEGSLAEICGSQVGSEAYRALDRFIQNEMRMSHIYQPVMLRELLTRGGEASVQQIARALLAEDRSQVEYYERIATGMVGPVLTRRSIASKDRRLYRLNGAHQLSDPERRTLIDHVRCEDRSLSRTSAPTRGHTGESRNGYLPGTLRYEVLKQANFRCALCGISAEEKALEVDHIVPRNRGGTDDHFNLQALCYSCNATKRDRDDTDFRGVAQSYRERQVGCLFCDMLGDRIVADNALCYAIRDAHPVTPLHTLIVPKRHVSDWFALHRPERNASERLLSDMRDRIAGSVPRRDGLQRRRERRR